MRNLVLFILLLIYLLSSFFVILFFFFTNIKHCPLIADIASACISLFFFFIWSVLSPLTFDLSIIRWYIASEKEGESLLGKFPKVFSTLKIHTYDKRSSYVRESSVSVSQKSIQLKKNPRHQSRSVKCHWGFMPLDDCVKIDTSLHHKVANCKLKPNERVFYYLRFFSLIWTRYRNLSYRNLNVDMKQNLSPSM